MSCHAHANRPRLFPGRGEARLQEELPELWRERIRLVDDTSPEGWHAPSELLASDISVDYGLQVRKPLTVVSGVRWGVAEANGVEEHLIGVLVIRAPRGSI